QAAHQSGTSQSEMSGDVDSTIYFHQSPREWMNQHPISVLVEARHRVVAVLLHQEVAPGQFQILGHHLSHQLPERGARLPAQLTARLFRIAQQSPHLGRAEVAGIDAYDNLAALVDGMFLDTLSLPAQRHIQLARGNVNKLPYAVLLSGGDYVILRRLLLQHQPLCLNIIARMAPVAQ